jgi:hypothetical protein
MLISIGGDLTEDRSHDHEHIFNERGYCAYLSCFALLDKGPDVQ